MKVLFDLINEKIEDTEKLKFMTELEAFEEQDKYRNWYTGLTAISNGKSKLGVPIILPAKGFQMHKISIQTSATSGSIRTAYFEDEFKKDSFYYQVNYPYIFKNLLSKVSSEQILIIEVKGDTKETEGGTESIEVKQEKHEKKVIFLHRLSGPLNQKFEFNVTEDNDLKISFWRKLQSVHLEEWKNKRMTGMEIKWQSAP